MTKKTGSRAPIAPEVTMKGDHDMTRVSRHPSFATVGFYSTSANEGRDLFGANVRVANTIRMCISRAHMESGTVDRVQQDEVILELEMTEASFTQAITQFNRGTGTPATLRQGPDVDVVPVIYPEVVYPSVDERIKTKGDKRVERELAHIMAALAEVSEVAKTNGSVPKRAMQDAVRKLEIAMQNLPGNLAYYKDLLREDADSFLNEAKMELHASAALLASDARAPTLSIDAVTED